MKKITRFVAIIMTFVMLFSLTYNDSIKANAQSLYIIRVGLTKNLKAQSTVKIKTKKIALGYCVNNVYSEYIHFTNSSGFKFKPATGYYLVSDTVYPTYAKAIAAYNKARKISKSKKYTYLAMTGKNKWNIYVGGLSDIEKVNNFKTKLQKKLSTTFAITSYNGHRVRILGGSTKILYDGADTGQYVQIVANVLNSKGSQTLTANGYEYRGRLEIAPYGANKLTVVNVLNVENYLRGVVGTEMGTSYPLEALRAQAIVSRTFAQNQSANTGDTNIKNPYTLNDTASSQSYDGYKKESNKAVLAVTSTRGKTIYSGDEQIAARFFKSSGGMTESAKNVWGLAESYLKSVSDINDLGYGVQPWTKTFTAASLGKALKIGTVTSVKVDKTTSSGRIYQLSVKGSDGSVVLKGENIINQLKIKSTKCSLITPGNENMKVSLLSASGVSSADSLANCYALNSSKKAVSLNNGLTQYVALGAKNAMNYLATNISKENAYIFAGLGSGHGVGFSQAGAKAMATRGSNYSEIIKNYYGSKVKIR
ncbi:MAG: SpoIID/LytB domain-containing protein [Lachnospiraceae bacterium]|nr:SpoIID/LytB domain-containing protein [Lachnospiraceae bacterium]